MKFILLPILLFLFVQPATAQTTDTPFVSKDSIAKPWGTTQGVTMFRGNPTRTWYGTGPLPEKSPKMLWRYPDRPLAATSCFGNGHCPTWSGTGWTGQPVVWERSDGITEVIIGTFDKQVHFINAETGKALRKPFPTNDIIKGGPTLDPDGFPLLYFGSRDDNFRILSLENGKDPKELWRLNAYEVRPQLIMGNDDWDGNAAVINDHLFVGGENGWIYIYKLNRHLDKATGKVSVSPKKVVEMPGWHPDLTKYVGDRTFSIESSVVVFENRAYFANSAGYVIGIDFTKVENFQAKKVFEFWAGDDIDGTMVVDKKGHLYISVQHELDYNRRNYPSAKRILDVGQVVKLNPYVEHPPMEANVSALKNPSVLWRFFIPPKGGNGKGGVWGTPAIDTEKNVLYVPTHPGDLIAIDTNSGEELWRKHVGYNQWSSPLLIDDKLLLGTCTAPRFLLLDVATPKEPKTLWDQPLPNGIGGCIESTPAVWKGRIYVGIWDGYIYSFGEK